MIKHHPKHELLKLHVKGQLPASISAAISMHAEMCSECNKTLQELTLSESKHAFDNCDSENNAYLNNKEVSFSSMIAGITSDDDIYLPEPKVDKIVNVKGKQYILPRAIAGIEHSQFQNLGKLSRSRLDLNEGEVHTSLLHIDPQGTVPAHTHKGFELTLLLDGCFTDELGSYSKGDFIWLNKSHTHTPETKNGCLCYTVSSDALHFTKGLARILNPIGNFIY
jgi:putative transcriptional regulator